MVLSIWFDGSDEIKCNIQQVKNALENIGEYYRGVIKLMPGMTSVKLVEQGSDSVIIRTNEGLMKRINILKDVEAESIVVECDEEYQAGKVTTKTHFRDEFTITDSGVQHRTTMSGLETSGFLGFFYRKLGSSSMGNAFLKAHKTYLENETD